MGRRRQEAQCHRNMTMMEFDYDELVRATDRFSPSRLVGKGSHGCVYKGVLDRDCDTVVAIKTSTTSPPSPSSSVNSSAPNGEKAEKLKKLRNEISVLSSLPQNPHVVSFLGASRDANANATKLMVMEFMPNGSLYHLLHVATTTLVAFPKRVEIALQIARAIRFLHLEEAIIHRDIKSANVLFDSSWNAKVADFGLAVSQQEDSASQASPSAGTIGYLDPYYTSPAKLSTKTDVFSYGVVLLEIMSCRKAIDLSRSPASLVEWAIPLINSGKIGEICGGRSDVSAKSLMDATIERLLRLAARCVSPDAESRPSSGEIVVEIGWCLTEPARNVPIWISVLRGVILLKRRRKRGKRCRETLTETEASASWVSRIR